MKATVTIDLSTPQANLLLGYLKSLPYATVETTKGSTPKTSKWQQALDEGATSVDEFIGEVKRQIKEHYDHA